MTAATGGIDDPGTSYDRADATIVPIVSPPRAAADAADPDVFGAIGPPTRRVPRRTALAAGVAGFLPPVASAAASVAASAVSGVAAPKPKRRSPRKKPAEAKVAGPKPTNMDAAPQEETTTATPSETPAMSVTPRARRTTGAPRKRNSGIPGLGERARALPEWQTLLSLPDVLFSALPALRQGILNRPLDDALQYVAEGLVLALVPATTRIWIADVTPWSGGASRVGGSGMFPALRLRARAHALSQGALSSVPAAIRVAGEDATLDPPVLDPLVAEIAASRRPALLFDAVGHPLAQGWAAGPDGALPALGTLAAYPLCARGQFLGVLAIGAASRLNARQLAALEELADLVALAADRDRLLSYSRGQEALAQTVVQHAPVAMALITGQEHLLALANPAFASLLGVESDTLLAGRRLAEVIGERARSIAASLRLDAAYAGDEPQAMVELPMHREARVTYWNVTTSPVIGLAKGGALVAAVEVTRQVMARRRAQESAEVAEERLRQMMSLHAASLAVASQLDADPRQLLADLLHRSLGLLNAQAGTIYVRDPRRETLDVVVSQGLRREYSGSRLEAGEGLAGQVARARRGLVVDDYHASPVRAALYQDEIASAAIAVPLIHHNEVVGVLEVLGDAARRSFSEADLWLLELFAAQAAQAIQNARMYVELERAYRKQRELDRLKDDFIATASHELRTPLTGVQGFLELLLDLPAAQSDPLVITFARKAAAAAEELAEIAERLLQTSRLDTGRLDLHTGLVPLAPLVNDVLAAFREIEQSQGGAHELLCAIPPEVTVVADRGRLKEVLDNLVSNALKYSPAGGRVAVACGPFGGGSRLSRSDGDAEAAIDERPTLELPPVMRDDAGDAVTSVTQPLPAVSTAAEGRPYVMITVRDEGMGIPPGERARLFGRFARLDGARVSQIRGTGLGLYICRQLTRAMGGDVWLMQSALGEGSTFAVALPVVVTCPVGSQDTALISIPPPHEETPRLPME